MKTADRENPKRWANVPSNRALGAGGQNKSCSIQWAEKQEKLQPAQKCFFLTSTFIELTRQVELLPERPSFVLQSPDPKVTLTPLFVGPRSEQLQ
jgi:hypothetical protein